MKITYYVAISLDGFIARKDGRNLINELREKGYTFENDLNKIKGIKNGKLAALTAQIHNPRMADRGDMLPASTQTAINILSKNDQGFFLMVEGSQIDWGGHAASTIYIVEDMLDFDQAIGKALEFAAKDGETLVVVTSDHETGGMAITGGIVNDGIVKAGYPTAGHTAVMVPIFAYGPGADQFIGIMKNTDVHDHMKRLLLGD